MTEPERITLDAGKYQRDERPRVLRTFDDIRALLAPAYSPTVADQRPLFLDISQYDDIDLDVVANFNSPKIWGVFVRIGGSAAVKDTKFSTYWPWAKRAGLLRQIYTYNWPGWAVSLHIQNFMLCVEDWCEGDLGDGPIIIDAECHADKTRKQVSDHTIGYAQALIAETGKSVEIYSGDWFIRGYMEFQDWMKTYKWWLATWMYPDQPFEHPGPPTVTQGIPKENVKWHQTGSNCRADIFGGTTSDRIDTDRWNLSLQSFYDEYGIQQPQPPNGDLETRVEALENWARGLAFNE